jgi:GAF domain-containing protein
MYDHALFVRTLSDFTRLLLTPYDVSTALAELADRVSEVLGLLGSGVSLARDGRLEFDTVYGAGVAAIERVQQEVQAGPCVTAFQTGEVVVVTDIEVDRLRWPEYTRAASAAGVTSVASIPLQLGDRAVGALNLYARGRRDWSSDDVAAAVVLADMATACLINASHHRQQVELTRQLQHALDSRVVIEQAKGILAGRRNISPEKAFTIIRAHARSRHATVSAVAEGVIHLGLEP